MDRIIRADRHAQSALLAFALNNNCLSFAIKYSIMRACVIAPSASYAARFINSEFYACKFCASPKKYQHTKDE